MREQNSHQTEWFRWLLRRHPEGLGAAKMRRLDSYGLDRMEEDLYKAAMTREARLRLDPASQEPTGSRTELASNRARPRDARATRPYPNCV